MDSWIRSLLFALVRLYQRAVSPLLVPSCRFEPSCSHYALEALQTWPLGRALWLILKRLSRCQPFCKAGFDPVPRYPGHRGHRILSGSHLFRSTPVSGPCETDAGADSTLPTRCSGRDGRCSHG